MAALTECDAAAEAHGEDGDKIHPDPASPAKLAGLFLERRSTWPAAHLALQQRKNQ